MRSDDAPKAPAAGGWFRTCHRTLPLCTLGRNIVAGSRSPPPDAALEVGDKKVAEEEEVDDDAGSGWDGKYLVQTGFDVPLVGAERRHSGWEAVEKRWGPPPPLPRRDSEREKTPVNGGDGDNDSSAQLQAPPLALPPPRLEPDFRLRLVLKPADATLPPTDPGQPWNTVTGGAWVGKLGRGLVTGGCQETLQVPLGNGAPATQVEARFQLRTAEEPPVVIECRAKGAIAGPPGAPVGHGSHRMVLTMRTADTRYAEAVNVGMWVATCLWLGNEVIYDVYRIV